LTKAKRFHRFKEKVKSKNSGEKFYGFRQILGVDEKDGFKKEGKERRDGEVSKIL
jgi:hypothetical protein